MDENILNKNGQVFRNSFENENQEQIVAHVATTKLFVLHTLNPKNMELWEHMNLKRIL